MRLLLAIALVACAAPARVVIVYDLCSPKAMRPAVQCSQGQLGYDGCRWRCTLEPVEQEPAHLGFDFHGYHAEGQ